MKKFVIALGVFGAFGALFLASTTDSIACYTPIKYQCQNGILYYTDANGTFPVVTRHGTWYRCR